MQKLLPIAVAAVLLAASCKPTNAPETPSAVVPATEQTAVVPTTAAAETPLPPVDIKYKMENGKTYIYVSKEGKEEKISLADFEKNKEMYEKKYGSIPPPPPPPPPVPMPPPPPPIQKVKMPPPPPPVEARIQKSVKE